VGGFNQGAGFPHVLEISPGYDTAGEIRRRLLNPFPTVVSRAVIRGDDLKFVHRIVAFENGSDGVVYICPFVKAGEQDADCGFQRKVLFHACQLRVAYTNAGRPSVFCETQEEAQREHEKEESKHALFGAHRSEFYGANKKIAFYANGSHAAPFVAVRAPMLKNDVRWILGHVLCLVRHVRAVNVDVHAPGCPD
jgi:hypothetical protein